MSMKTHTKRYLDAAVDELRRDGYMVLVVLLDQKSDEQKAMGNAMEVLCSETNDPNILAAMLRNTLACLSNPAPPERSN
jgi:hypothetical protein